MQSRGESRVISLGVVDGSGRAFAAFLHNYLKSKSKKKTKENKRG